MGKKNLEQLFKESFRDFQEVPDESVWNSIEASLDKKKQKKRALPIWWSLGSVAAALVILMMIINPFAAEPEEQIITDRESIDVPEEPYNSKEEKSEDFTDPSITLDKEESLVNSSKKNKNAVQNNNQKSKNTSEDVVMSAVAENTTSTSQRNGSVENRQANNSALRDSEMHPSEKVGAEKSSAIAMNDGENKSDQKQSVAKKSVENDQIAQNAEEQDGEVEKKSIYDAIIEQDELEEAVATSGSEKWSIGPSLAPVYFNAAGDGSPVSSDFASNSKSGTVNLSYGLTVAYDVGKKLKIRSGVHRVNYGYNTDNVVFSSVLRAASTDKLANIDYNSNASTIVVESKDSPKNTAAFNSKEIALADAPSLDGRMVQQLGYIEIPLELNYAVLDKKFGVELIGGVSSLFLVDNAVLLESNELITEMGEANNINSLNFSANLGMGLNYRFSPKIRVNIEPVFKYQLNTFSNVSGSFQPYSIGVYSGFSFRF
ncbi:outer membrane beta-barrel protein [Muricauda sp. NFXS6]|uniref:outer membrane beta-barrel protein n=1 Tax=Allomuricauda sp. NFXS6 TaxID=2819094 RepID=UPI0032DFBE09